MADTDYFAWECRDKEDEARIAHDNPDRRLTRQLEQENLQLKRLLRENGIAWSPVSKAYLSGGDPSVGRRRTRSLKAAQNLGNPHLPMELILRIMAFALTSQQPIIDPLTPCTPKNITKQEEKERKSQIAFGVLSTCKALREEGSQILWTSNTFTFTSPQALRNFAALDAKYRSQISHVNFRVIAQYYDDDRSRGHRLSRSYHRDLKRDLKLKVEHRPKEGPLIRPGFRSYSWSQIVDFFVALRPPYDPRVTYATTPRPRLLPALTSLRLDLVNFADGLLPFSGSEFHDIASHEFGCTLNELQVTGMPFDDAGIKATCELCGLLKDEGLYLDCIPTFVQGCKGRISQLSGATWCGRVVRAHKAGDSDLDDEDGDDEDDYDDYAVHHPKLGLLPPAPVEPGHPETPPGMGSSIIWKRVPVARDDTTREWIPYRRQNGYEAKNIAPRRSSAVHVPEITIWELASDLGFPMF